MKPEELILAASMLVERRRQGVQAERLPENLRPQNLDDALALQQAVTEDWCNVMDDTVGAWKCSLPAPGKIVAAPIYTRTIDSVPPVALWPKNNRARIEPELAFFLGEDLPARTEPYTVAEIDAAIVRTHMALELINSRYIDAASCTFPEMLADGLVNQGLFVGPEVNSESAYNASELMIHVRNENGEVNEYPGKHPNGLPRAPVYWLVEFLRSRGQNLVAGQAIITGSYAGVIELPLNTEFHISYAGLGEMQVSFMARQYY